MPNPLAQFVPDMPLAFTATSTSYAVPGGLINVTVTFTPDEEEPHDD